MRDLLAHHARHPDSIFLQLLCLFSGFVLVLSPEQPGSLERLLPGWLTAIWAGFLLLGAGANLTGMFWPDRTTGLLWEFLGRVLLVIGSALYATGFLVISGGLQLPDVIPLLAFGGFCAWRAVQVLRPIRDADGILRIMRHARENRDEP